MSQRDTMFGPARFCISLAGVLMLFALAQAGTTPRAKQEEPFSKDALNRHVLSLGQPPGPFKFPLPEDQIYRRGKGVVLGRMESLMAFATVKLPKLEANGKPESPFEEVHIPRDELHFILLNGGSFPTRPPLLSVEEDSVLLKNGKVLSGIVTVLGNTVHVAGQSVPTNHARLIHLRDPHLASRPIQAKEGARERDQETPTKKQPREAQEKKNDPEDKAPACWVGNMVYKEKNIFLGPSGSTSMTKAKLRLALTETLNREEEGRKDYKLDHCCPGNNIIISMG